MYFVMKNRCSYMYIFCVSCNSGKTQFALGLLLVKHMKPGPWFNIKMSSYQYRKSHCGDKTVVRSSYLHSGISYTGKMSSLYWISAQEYFAQFYPWLCAFHTFMSWWHHDLYGFHLISPLWGESNSDWWIPFTKGKSCRPLMFTLL